MRNYIHDEFKQLGTDYNSVDEVAQYDARMRQFRDIESENRHLSRLAGVLSGSVVMEIGTGTGAWACHAAQNCQWVDALDISTVMLEYAISRAKSKGLKNISFIHAGFLSYDYPLNKYDAVVNSLVMHHLSDVWKAVALQKIFSALKPGGILALADVVFNWEADSPETYFKRILEYAPGSKDEFARHIADELSTQDWIMTGLLERAGFSIESTEVQQEFLYFYQCRKPACGA